MIDKKSICIGIVFFLVTCAGIQTAGAEPAAPLLELTDQGMQMVKNQGKTLADVENNIPTKASIGIPIYPEAFYATHVEGTQEGSYPMLPSINLVSSDSPETITAWYRDNLAGWQYDETFVLFHDAEGEADMDSLMSVETQTVSIMAEDDPGLDLMFYKTDDVKSRIIIRYKPKE